MKFGHGRFLREALIREQEAESLLRHRRRPRRTRTGRKLRRAVAQPTAASYVVLAVILIALAFWIA
jgi:hypothetical protein